MAQDPAQLFYYKDWITSTAGMEADERGWYINLLAHQMDKPEGLPSDVEKLAVFAGVKFSDYAKFVQCWERTLKHMFQAYATSGIANEKLMGVMSRRKEFTDNQAIRGSVGSYMKQVKNDPQFPPVLHKTLSAALIIAFKLCKNKEGRDNIFLNEKERTLAAYAASNKGNVIANANGIKDIENGGAGEREKKYLVQKMQDVWMSEQPKYPRDVANDYMGLGEISRFIAEQEKLTTDPAADPVAESKVLEAWTVIAHHVAGHDFFRKYSIAQVSKHIQSIIQDIYHGGKQGSKHGKPAEGFNADYKRELADRMEAASGKG